MRLRYQPCPKCRNNGKDSRGDNLVVYPDGSEHCYACRYHRNSYFRFNENSVEPINYGSKNLLPADFTREVPANAWQWVLQYGLPWSYWKDSCGYSPSQERLVFLVESEHQLQFSNGRYVGQSTDKHIPKWHVWGNAHKHCHVIQSSIHNPGVVLVEDLISAAKVAVSGYTSIPLFGTKIHPCHLWYLSQSNEPIYLWLDKDQELNVKKQAMQLAALISLNVTVVITKKDAKWLSSAQIQHTLVIK